MNLRTKRIQFEELLLVVPFFVTFPSLVKVLYLDLRTGIDRILFLGISEDSSPEAEGKQLGTSPRINRFLAREPPDGCERVSMKFQEENRLENLYFNWHDSDLERSIQKYDRNIINSMNFQS